MRFSRRIFLRLAAATAGLPLMPGLASAEVYPSRPVRMIVDIPAGLAPDVLARLIGEPLSHRFGQNWPGRVCRVRPVARTDSQGCEDNAELDEAAKSGGAARRFA